jgi:hypothetical protein
MFAEILVHMGVANNTHVGMYALLGAAGFLGGLMRMSAAQVSGGPHSWAYEVTQTILGCILARLMTQSMPMSARTKCLPLSI